MPEQRAASDIRPVVTYSRDTILDAAQLGLALGVSAATVERMDLPFFRAGNRTRYVYGQVVDALADRAKANGAPAEPFRLTVKRGKAL